MAGKKLSKQNKIAAVVLAALTVAFAVFLPLYLKNNEENRALYKEQKIKFSAFGEEIGQFTVEGLTALDGVEEKEFSAVYDTSASEGVTKTYTGVELKSVLAALGINLYDARQITLKAADGAVKVYTVQEVAKSGNVYIAYKVNGRPFTSGIDGLGHTRDTEDGGPFVVIKVEDTFSTNRCKLLTEVTVE